MGNGYGSRRPGGDPRRGGPRKFERNDNPDIEKTLDLGHLDLE